MNWLYVYTIIDEVLELILSFRKSSCLSHENGGQGILYFDQDDSTVKTFFNVLIRKFFYNFSIVLHFELVSLEIKSIAADKIIDTAI